jgi:hypothetical protein
VPSPRQQQRGRQTRKASAEDDNLLWHETYFLQGGMEAIYDDVPQLIGFMAFARVLPARGPTFGAAARTGKEFESQPVLSEKELYDEPEA